MRKGFRTQPARLVRGSSRRIMTMRFRPANIRLINRRVCSSAVAGSAVPTRGSKLTSRNVFPPTRPSRNTDAATVLASKGSLTPLRALARSAPLQPDNPMATGGSGRNTPSQPTKRPVRPIEGANRPGIQNPVSPEGLTRSLHIRSTASCRAGRLADPIPRSPARNRWPRNSCSRCGTGCGSRC